MKTIIAIALSFAALSTAAHADIPGGRHRIHTTRPPVTILPARQPTPVSGKSTLTTAQKAKVRKLARAEAKDYLKDHSLRVNRPSVRVTFGARRGKNVVGVEITGMRAGGVRPPPWMPRPRLRRFGLYMADFSVMGRGRSLGLKLKRPG